MYSLVALLSCIYPLPACSHCLLQSAVTPTVTLNPATPTAPRVLVPPVLPVLPVLPASSALQGLPAITADQFSSVAARINPDPNSRDSAPQPIFKTPKADGPFRDEITVEIVSINGKEFKGTITPTEARVTIFQDVLGFKQEDLAGVKIGYNQVRLVTFKLKQQFDVDELFEWERFEFERSIGQEVNSIKCLIRGLRDPNRRRVRGMTDQRHTEPTQEVKQDDGTSERFFLGTF